MALDPVDRRRYGSFQPLELLQQGDRWLLAKCLHDSGQLAVVKAARGESSGARHTLHREASLLWHLAIPGHDGVVKILEQAGGHEPFWFAMAWLNGAPLLERHGPTLLPLTQALGLGHRLAEALEYVHSRGVVHGDVSPANALVEEGGRVTLIDFGTAALAYDSHARREIGHTSVPRDGTPGFLAPERIQSGSIDARSDLYSLGCILYELFTGQPPFRADEVGALARKHVECTPPSPSLFRPELPRQLERLILNLLEKDPARRTASASEVCEALRANSPGWTAPAAARPRYVPFHRSRLVGREPALLTVTAAIDRARLGLGGLQLVSGESGIGKTRLLNEASRYASASGLEVVFGHCQDLRHTQAGSSSGRTLGAFLPLLAWVAEMRRGNPDGWDGDLEAALAVLANYEPSLGKVEPEALPMTLPPELARARVLQSLATVMLAACQRQPFLLIVDDIQWADDLSSAFLTSDHPLTFSRARLLLVAAYRSDELPIEHQARLEGRATGVTKLERLTEDQVSLLARGLLGSEVIPAQVSQLLYRHSGGNPFWVIEYVHSLKQQGALRPATHDPNIAELTGATYQLHPGGFKELFELRLAELSPAARKVLEFAAVLGAEFPSELLVVAGSELDSGLDTTSAIWELGAQRLLEALPGGRCRFVHDKLREAQLSLLTPARRRELHRHVAHLLSTSQRFSPSSAELGLHFVEAGLSDRAGPHLKAAAEQASHRYANADAIELYGLALTQLRAQNGPSLRGESRLNALELAEARGDVLLRSGRNSEAAHQYGEATEWADAVGRARLMRKQATALRIAHDYEGAKIALEGAELALASAGAEHEASMHEWLEVQQSRFWLHYFERQGGPITEAIIERMRPVVERDGTSIQRAIFFECLASHLMARDRYLFSREAVESARRALAELGGTSEYAGQLADRRFVLAFALVLGSLEDCREAVELFQTTIEELEPIGDPMLLSRALMYQSIAHRRLGHADAVRATIERTRRYAERAQLTPYVGACCACEGWLHWQEGDLQRAEFLTRQAADWWSKGSHVFPFRWLADFVELDLHHLQDDFPSALEVIQRLLDPTQMAFDEPLTTALGAAKDACNTQDARTASRALVSVLQLAHQGGYL